MITKEVSPIISNNEVVGTMIEYRIFRLLIYKKILYTPARYGLKEFEMQTNF